MLPEKVVCHSFFIFNSFNLLENKGFCPFASLLFAVGMIKFFQSKKKVILLQGVVMDELGMKRALMRISHEIIEKNESVENLCVVGIRRKGVQLANIICQNLQDLGANVNNGVLDITRYRDDITHREIDARVNETLIDFSIHGKTVILVDDVLYTGRTARAALDAILALGRPEKIQLAVLVDRGHRELPIRADYVGKNIPTSKSETIKVCIPPYEEEAQVKIIRQS